MSRPNRLRTAWHAAIAIVLAGCATPRLSDSRSGAGCTLPAAGGDFEPFTAFLAAFNSRDLAAFGQAFAPEASFFPDLREPAHLVDGRDRIVALFAPGFRELPPSFVLKPTAARWRAIGGTVLVTFELAFPYAVGRRTIVFRCDDARWRIAHLHASSVELPAPGTGR